MNGNKKSILLVEDQALIALAEKQELKKAGYTVHHAISGEEAIAAALAPAASFDLILMDIDLGSGMDGTQAAEQILEKKDIPVLFLSSHTEPEVVEKTEKITSYGYAVKNSGITVLDASIKMALKLYEAYRKYHKRNQELYALAEELEQTNEELTSTEEELRSREAALTESDKRFRSVLELVPDMISIHDPEMNILYSNWRSLAEVPEDKRQIPAKCHKVYRNLEEICPDCLAKNVLETGRPLRKEAELPDGMWVDIRAIPVLDKENRVTMFVEWVRDITEDKRTLEKLKHREEEYRRLFETMSPGVVYHNADGTIISANPAAEKILGLSVDQMNGKTTMDPRWKMIDDQGHDILGADHPAMRALARGEIIGPVDRAIFIPEKNEYVWLSITATPLFHKGEDTPYQVYSTFENITGRKLAEKELKEKNSLLERVFDNNIDLIALTDLEGNYKLAGKSHEILGYDPASLIGKNVMSFVHPEDLPTVVQEFTEFLQTPDKNRKVVYRNRKIDGQYLWFETTGTILKDKYGKPEQILFNTRDITGRKQVEEEIERQLSEKETLLKEVHHRIKNNMSQIEGLLSLQASSTENALARTALQEALSRVGSIRLLYEKLLIDEVYQQLSIREYTESLIESLAAVFPEHKEVVMEKKITDFTLSSKTIIPVGIIINELVTNAFKYAFPERNNGRIIIRIDRTGNLVSLTIQDNGIGIEEERAFHKSPGFGLTIVKMLAEQLGGTCAVENDSGTRVVIRFNI